MKSRRIGKDRIKNKACPSKLYAKEGIKDKGKIENEEVRIKNEGEEKIINKNNEKVFKKNNSGYFDS